MKIIRKGISTFDRNVRKFVQFLWQWYITYSPNRDSVGSIVFDILCSLTHSHTYIKHYYNTLFTLCVLYYICVTLCITLFVRKSKKLKSCINNLIHLQKRDKCAKNFYYIFFLRFFFIIRWRKYFILHPLKPSSTINILKPYVKFPYLLYQHRRNPSILFKTFIVKYNGFRNLHSSKLHNFYIISELNICFYRFTDMRKLF